VKALVKSFSDLCSLLYKQLTNTSVAASRFFVSGYNELHHVYVWHYNALSGHFLCV